MKRPIGIDLGTTNSCLATIDAAGHPRTVTNRQGQLLLPSVVSFLKDPAGRANILVGAPARRQAITNPRETIFGAKRLIGRRFDDREVRRLAATLPYEVIAAPNGDAWVRVADRPISPQEVLSYVLEQLRLVAEPTAAALGYGAHREPNARLAVFDLGGGTFDVSLVNVEDGVFEVISTHGDNMLGGDDFDRRMVERLVEEIKEQHGLDVTSDPTALARLREEAEKAKVNLSEAAQATLQIPYLGKAKGQVVNYIRILKRQELESWTADIVQRLEAPCREAMQACGVRPGDLDQVILVGGMTRMPAVQRKVEQIFGKRPTKSANPDEAIAIGAATECAILAGKIEEVILLDVTSRTLGLHVGGGKFAPVIPRNATLPARETRLVATQRDSQRELPVEVYAGESADVRRNRPLGTFVLGGLPDAPAGEVMVLVDFTVDVDGCLAISAREVTSGAHADIRLTATCGLTRAEVSELASLRRARVDRAS